MWSIAIIVSVCLSVHRISNNSHVQTSRNFLYMLSVAMARSSTDSATCYALPVLCTKSCFHIIGTCGVRRGLRMSRKTRRKQRSLAVAAHNALHKGDEVCYPRVNFSLIAWVFLWITVYNSPFFCHFNPQWDFFCDTDIFSLRPPYVILIRPTMRILTNRLTMTVNGFIFIRNVRIMR